VPAKVSQGQNRISFAAPNFIQRVGLLGPFLKHFLYESFLLKQLPNKRLNGSSIELQRRSNRSNPGRRRWAIA